MFRMSISSIPVTGDVPISLSDLVVVSVAFWEEKVSFGVQSVCGTAALSSRLYNSGALARISKACGDSATVMKNPLRAEVKWNAS